MARGAANERALGGLHSKLTDVFIKVPERYTTRLEVLENHQEVDFSELGEEFLTELFNEGAMPNPAMLSAVSKFLKDNEISFDTEQINELSGLEKRLADMKSRRGNVVSMKTLARTADG